MYTEALPGPDGPASEKFNQDYTLDKEADAISEHFSTVKRAIRVLF